MIKIQIGHNDNERHLRDADVGWINQQISRRKKEGVPVCVRVTIHKDSVYIILSTPDCPKVARRQREARDQEKKIFGLWDKYGLNNQDFRAEQLIAFLKQTRDLDY